MKDIEIMTGEEKHRYVFEDTSFEGRPRVNWISNCLLGDIRTFLDGIQNRIREKHDGKYFSDGFGNLSVPILINTALEFVAALCDKGKGLRARGQRSEGRSQRSEVGGRKSEVGSRKSEVRNQRSEIRGRKSEVRSQRFRALIIHNSQLIINC